MIARSRTAHNPPQWTVTYLVRTAHAPSRAAAHAEQVADTPRHTRDNTRRASAAATAKPAPACTTESPLTGPSAPCPLTHTSLYEVRTHGHTLPSSPSSLPQHTGWYTTARCAHPRPISGWAPVWRARCITGHAHALALSLFLCLSLHAPSQRPPRGLLEACHHAPPSRQRGRRRNGCTKHIA